MIDIKNETAGLDLKDVRVRSGVFQLTIGKKTYSYQASGLTADDLYKKFKSIQRYSDGKALAWLKKNAMLVGAYEN